MKTNIFALSCLFMLSMYACSPEEDTEEVPNPADNYSNTELTLHNADRELWKLTKEYFNNVDITASNQPCEMDNVHIFQAQGNYIIDAGDSKCENNPEPDQVLGKFLLNEDETKITFTFPDTSFTAEILVLDGSEFTWETEVDGEMIKKQFLKQ